MDLMFATYLDPSGAPGGKTGPCAALTKHLSCVTTYQSDVTYGSAPSWVFCTICRSPCLAHVVPSVVYLRKTHSIESSFFGKNFSRTSDSPRRIRISKDVFEQDFQIRCFKDLEMLCPPLSSGELEQIVVLIDGMLQSGTLHGILRKPYSTKTLNSCIGPDACHIDGSSDTKCR